MIAIEHYVGNTAPSLYYQIRATDENGVEGPFVIPPGASVRFFLRNVGTGELVINNAATTILNPTQDEPTDEDVGVVRYDWTTEDVAGPPDEFVGWFRVSFPGGFTQDTPEFTWTLKAHWEQPSTVVGLYTSVSALKDFTTLADLKSSSDEVLAENVIPRAEAWLTAFGPFKTTTCPQLKLAANLIAEYIFRKVNPKLVNTQPGAIKSENIGDYSYTLSDVAGADAGPFEDLLREIEGLVSVCLADNAMPGGFAFGSTHVFEPLRGYEYDGHSVLHTFEITREINTLREFLNWGSTIWRVLP